MRESDVLFELIRQLDKEEYKFVLEYARGGKAKPNQRDLLIADLRDRKEYNPQLLRPKYKNYEVLKYQARQVVLQALRLYHEASTIDQEIALHLQNERLFYAKGLYGPAEKELAEAQRLAEQYQKLARLLDILHLKQFRLVERQTKDLKAAVAANLADIQKVLAALQAQTAAFCAYQELFAAYRTEGSTESDASAEVHLDSLHRNFYRDLYRNAAESLAAQVAGDYKKAAELAEAALRLFDSEPEIKEELQLKYKIQLANLGVLLAGLGRYREVEEVIQQLKRFTPLNFNDEAETFQNTIHLELILMVSQWKFEGQANLIQRVEAGLVRYDAKVNAARKLSLLYNLMVLYIVNENYRAANKVVDMILDRKKFKVRKDVQYITRLLQLVIYHELELWDLPDHPITAVKRYLERKGKLSEFKALVLDFLSRLANAPINEKAEVFEEMDLLLREKAREEKPPGSLGLALVAAWARSKYTRQTVKECLQQPAPGGNGDAPAPDTP
jgi:regulator of sigma D